MQRASAGRRPKQWRRSIRVLLLMLSSGTSLASAVRGNSPEEAAAARERLRRALAAVRTDASIVQPAKTRHAIAAIPARSASCLPVAIVSVEPARPVVAELAGESGRLVIECVVDEQGLVRDCIVLESWPVLEAPALAALAQWRFRPALVDGKPQNVLLAWTWKHDPDARRGDWRPGWKFRWDLGALVHQW